MNNKNSIFILFLIISLPFLMMAQDTIPEKYWPKVIIRDQGKIVIYQPQIDRLTEDQLQARSALAVTMAEKPTTLYGAMWFECRIETDFNERLVYLRSVKVTAAKFPDLEPDRVDRINRFLEAEIPTWEMVFSLDELLLSLEGAEYEAKLARDLNNDAPEIIFSKEPAALVLIDGEPKFKVVEKTEYEYVVNTAFFIVREKESGDLYLKGGDYWFKSDNIRSEWRNISIPPKRVQDIAKKAMGQEEQIFAGDSIKPPVPRIYLRTHPAELIQSQGEPEYVPVDGTELLYMTNTADHILMDIENQLYYTLVAGKWYATKSLASGQWRFVPSEELPEDFINIPTTGDLADIRASIPGTQEAREAVLTNQIPQTAEVDRQVATLTVTYDGEAKFEPVGTTDMQYAVNTDKSVLLIDGKYYCCDDAIWFESVLATGPWTVSTSVPRKVQEIPPENPHYNVKYVYIYDYTPEVVYVGYTPGYCHSYIYGPTVVYGTGYYYAPWYGAYYYARPVTYGYGASWNPYTGWGFSYGVSVGGPYGWFSFGWHPPYYGYWGPVGYRHGYYGHRSGSTVNVNPNIYASRGDRLGSAAGVKTPSRPAAQPATQPSGGKKSSARPSRSPSGTSRATAQSPGRPASGNAKTPSRPATADLPNDVITDRDGSIYRKDEAGWQRRESGDWKSGLPANSKVELDFDNRQRSQQRSQTYQQNRPQYQQTRPSGSYNRSMGSAPAGQTSGGGTPRGGRR